MTSFPFFSFTKNLEAILHQIISAYSNDAPSDLYKKVITHVIEWKCTSSPIICAFSALLLGRAADVPPSKIGTLNFYENLDTLTSLQKHVAFFDRNKDGIIFPQESYYGMHAIGVDSGLAIMSALFINGILSPKTSPSGQHLSSAAFPVYVENIIKAKHNGTGIFDSNGMFVPEKLEEIFATYSRTKPDALTYQELNMMLQEKKTQLDTNGYFAVYSEWTLLYKLGKDKDGFLYKDTVRGVFDGSLFYKLEKENPSTHTT